MIKPNGPSDLTLPGREAKLFHTNFNSLHWMLYSVFVPWVFSLGEKLKEFIGNI